VKKFTVYLDRWRCGGDSDSTINHVHGEGMTALLNSQGYMCCLGFACQQLGGLTEDDMFEVDTPESTFVVIEGLTEKKDGVDMVLDTDLSRKAVQINDDGCITLEAREEELTALFKLHGIEVEFVSKAPDDWPPLDVTHREAL
jgi:hypothetical protein